jgi:hypothetical protein
MFLFTNFETKIMIHFKQIRFFYINLSNYQFWQNYSVFLTIAR